MRRDEQRLTDILDSLDWIAKPVAGKAEADCLADETLRYAVAQKLTILGEAVARLSSDLTSRYDSVPWLDIAGLRNIVVHEYFGIYWPLVWQTVVDHAPVLRSQISGILTTAFPPPLDQWRMTPWNPAPTIALAYLTAAKTYEIRRHRPAQSLFRETERTREVDMTAGMRSGR